MPASRWMPRFLDRDKWRGSNQCWYLGTSQLVLGKGCVWGWQFFTRSLSMEYEERALVIYTLARGNEGKDGTCMRFSIRWYWVFEWGCWLLVWEEKCYRDYVNKPFDCIQSWWRVMMTTLFTFHVKQGLLLLLTFEYTLEQFQPRQLNLAWWYDSWSCRLFHKVCDLATFFALIAPAGPIGLRNNNSNSCVFLFSFLLHYSSLPQTPHSYNIKNGCSRR